MVDSVASTVDGCQAILQGVGRAGRPMERGIGEAVGLGRRKNGDKWAPAAGARQSGQREG